MDTVKEPAPPSSFATTSAPAKKRKNRSSFLVHAANSRLRSEFPPASTTSSTVMHHHHHPVYMTNSTDHVTSMDCNPLNTNRHASPASNTYAMPVTAGPSAASSGSAGASTGTGRGRIANNGKGATSRSHGGGADAAKRKGLRHFAVRVCRKVEEKGITTYNEVADELVNEERIARGTGLSGTLVDEKNIRRRVYDSLNVLMAMAILKKDKKQILWQGLLAAYAAASGTPDVVDKVRGLQFKVEEKRDKVQGKQCDVRELKDQLQRMNALMKRRNAERLILQQQQRIDGWVGNVHPAGANIGMTTSDIMEREMETKKLIPPFMVVRAAHNTNINLTMDECREEVCFSFDSRFGLFDDREILRRLPLLPEMSLQQDHQLECELG